MSFHSLASTARGAAALGLACAAALCATLPARAQTGNACGPIYNTGHYGPYDYRTDRQQLGVVEKFHFAPQVEALIRGMSGPLAGELNYVLKAAPNHHRALVSLMRLAQRQKLPHLADMDYSVECYFERGARFRPDDTVVRSLYAQYLGSLGRKSEAAAHLELALQHAGDNPFTHYNIGLVFFEIGAFDRALQQAHKAREMGLPKPELENQLRKANQWKEPTP